MADESFQDPRIPLASERTLLAWIRTSLALMGFGFVVARFGLLLREIAGEAIEISPPPAGGLSIWFGTGLVGLGAVTAFLAAMQHIRFLDTLERGETYRPRRWSLGVLVAGAVAVIGLLMGVYLVWMRH